LSAGSVAAVEHAAAMAYNGLAAAAVAESVEAIAGPGRRYIRYAWLVSHQARPTSPQPPDVIERAAAAYRALADLAETVEDEWQYVTDLVDAYLPGIRALAEKDAELEFEAVVAIDEAISEIGSITDPHKAIDWLSTFPHVVALAVAGDVDRPTGGTSTDKTEPQPEPDEDSPFRILLRRDR
jgi:hypothetical protein